MAGASTFPRSERRVLQTNSAPTAILVQGDERRERRSKRPSPFSSDGTRFRARRSVWRELAKGGGWDGCVLQPRDVDLDAAPTAF